MSSFASKILVLTEVLKLSQPPRFMSRKVISASDYSERHTVPQVLHYSITFAYSAGPEFSSANPNSPTLPGGSLEIRIRGSDPVRFTSDRRYHYLLEVSREGPGKKSFQSASFWTSRIFLPCFRSKLNVCWRRSAISDRSTSVHHRGFALGLLSFGLYTTQNMINQQLRADFGLILVMRLFGVCECKTLKKMKTLFEYCVVPQPSLNSYSPPAAAGGSFRMTKYTTRPASANKPCKAARRPEPVQTAKQAGRLCHSARGNIGAASLLGCNVLHE
ncbi:hypothetical protein FB451DRAFT_1171323 [Mycena latifolia]|nr:hypothetical protein FB451DRAFT_1171323 [Mycena latifolia]